LQLWREVGDEKEQARVFGYRGDCYVQHAKWLHDANTPRREGLAGVGGGLTGANDPLDGERNRRIGQALADYTASLTVRQELVRANKSDPDLREALAHAHNNFGRLETIRVRLRAAPPEAAAIATHHGEGKRLLVELVGGCEPGSPRAARLNAVLGRTHIALGEGYLACGDRAAALAEFRAAKGVFDALKRNPQLEYLTGYAWASLGCAGCLEGEEQAKSLRDAEVAIADLSRSPSQPASIQEFERRYRN
jgi:hypothetical protein